jgi:hypothetical protein
MSIKQPVGETGDISKGTVAGGSGIDVRRDSFFNNIVESSIIDHNLIASASA